MTVATVVVLEAARSLTHRELEMTDSLQTHQLAARTVFTAVSPGTEVAAYLGAPPLRPGNPYPRVVGYCNIAEVTAVGEAVRRYHVGDRIATFESHRSAFVCDEEAVIVRLPPQTDSAAASTTYLFQLGYEALLKGEARPGYNVAVIGLGTLGLATVAIGVRAGCLVTGFSDQVSSPATAAAFGAREVCRKAPPGREKLQALTLGTGFDIVVTTSNEWRDWTLALELVRNGGRIVVLGFPGRGQEAPAFNPLDSRFLYDKQLTIVAGGSSPHLDIAPDRIRFTVARNYAFILDLLNRGELPSGQLVSAVLPWRDLETAYRRLAAREPGILTFVLSWR